MTDCFQKNCLYKSFDIIHLTHSRKTRCYSHSKSFIRKYIFIISCRAKERSFSLAVNFSVQHFTSLTVFLRIQNDDRSLTVFRVPRIVLTVSGSGLSSLSNLALSYGTFSDLSCGRYLRFVGFIASARDVGFRREGGGKLSINTAGIKTAKIHSEIEGGDPRGANRIAFSLIVPTALIGRERCAFTASTPKLKR